MSQAPLSPDQNRLEEPKSELDLYGSALGPTTVDDEFLQRTNFGLGNYSSREMYQQVESFRDGLFADAAFSSVLLERAVDYTKRRLAEQQWQEEYGDQDDPDVSRREYIEANADDIWESLGSVEDREEPSPQQAKLDAMAKHAGVTSDWVPPHWRVMKMRHEASRSRDARLLDNVFGRVKVVKDKAQEGTEALLGGVRS